MAINPLPPAPQPTDSPQQFNIKAFAFVDALDDFGTEANALAVAANTSASNAANSASFANAKAIEAAASASLAQQTANVTQWASGTTYAVGDAVYSPTSFVTYRSRSAFTSNTDPVNDPVNWQSLEGISTGKAIAMAIVFG
jgi:hypothetical protein